MSSFQTLPLASTVLDEDEERAVLRVLRSGWLTAGQETLEFERHFAEAVAVPHAAAVSNCTAALHLAILAAGIGDGDEVLVPALTFVATANAVRYAGATPIFCDVTSLTDLNVNPLDIKRKISKRTKAILVVHYAGYAADMNRIMAIAAEHNLVVIEDCAHALFTVCDQGPLKGRIAGAIGDIGCFSFFGNKNMTTGEGGMVTTNSPDLDKSVRVLRSHGMTTSSYERAKGHSNSYDVVGLGYNYRIDDLRSAIGLAQLSKLDKVNARRRQLVAVYRQELEKYSNALVPFSDRDLEFSACHIMPIVVDNPEQVKSRLSEAGIQYSRHYALVPSFSTYSSATFETGYPELSKLITLPLGFHMNEKDVSRVVECVYG